MSDVVTRQVLRLRTAQQLTLRDVAGGNNAPSRVRPLRAEELPHTLVYTSRESGAASSPDGPPQFSTLIELVIDGSVDADDEVTLDDELDALADDVLAATLENPDWLIGIENVVSYEITKHPTGPDGAPVLGGVRIQMQVSVGVVIYSPDITEKLETVSGLRGTEGDPDFGIDFNGDGEIDIEFEAEIPQD